MVDLRSTAACHVTDLNQSRRPEALLRASTSTAVAPLRIPWRVYGARADVRRGSATFAPEHNARWWPVTFAGER